jgi:hypothetical protein
MGRRLLNRVAWNLNAIGIVMAILGVVSLINNHMTVDNNGVKEIITRQDHPAIYWSIGLGFLIIGVVLFVVGVYLIRKTKF